MFKVKFIAWPADDIDFKVQSVASLVDDSADVNIQVMTRDWPRDTNFTEVGVFTDDLDMAKFLAIQFKGRIWNTVAPH